MPYIHILLINLSHHVEKLDGALLVGFQQLTIAQSRSRRSNLLLIMIGAKLDVLS